MANIEKIQRVFSTPDVKHGVSLFTGEELEAIDNLVAEKDGKLFIQCLFYPPSP